MTVIDHQPSPERRPQERAPETSAQAGVVSALPADVKAELRRLLAAALVADYRAELEAVTPPRVKAVKGSNPRCEGDQ